MPLRTIEEIAARLREIRESDTFGFQTEVLAQYLPAEALREFAKPDADLSDWEPEPLEEASVLAEAADYLDFAWGKAIDHRGISASRSIDKLGEWLWILGNDEAHERFLMAGYKPYGAPQLAELSRFLERPIPNVNAAHRMAEGRSCRDDCWDGCGTGS